MKKKIFLTIAIVLCFVVFCMALVACVENTTEQGKPDNNTDGTSPDDGDQSGDDSDDDLDETPDAFVEFKLIFIVDEAEYHYIETAGNETIKLPDNPEKVGYVFDGWFWDKDIWSQPLTVSSFIDRPLTNDMKVYAKWITEEEAELSVVTFETNGGSELSAIRTNTLENAPVSVRNGYVLEGWYFTSSLNTEEKAIFPLTVTSDICLYAKWIPVRYQISYQTNGGVLPNNAKREYTIEEQVELPVPTNEGFTFAGWYETEDFTGAQVEVISIGQTGNRNYYAKWQINEYSIEFDTVGGSEIESVRYNFGAVITAPDAPQKTGYDFIGWYEDISYSTAFIFDKMPARNVKLYAKWSATRYDITYKIDGGILPAEAWTEYTIEDEYTLPQPQKEGLIFAGWYDNAELIGERVVRIVKGTTGDKEFWAKWDASGYSITYHLDGGVNGNNPPSYDTDSADIVFEDPYKTGHTFMGWFDNAEYTGEAITGIQSGSEGNKELWAKWQINTYSIRFVTNGGNEIADVEYEYNEQISAPVAPSRKGYYFEGWYNEELTEQYVFNRMPASDLTLYAKWTIEEYSITYFTYGGELPEGVILNNTYTVEDAITLPILEKEGHTFNGWYDNADFNGEPISGIAEGSTGSLLLYAKFTINSYTITFKNDDDSVITTVTQDFGTQLEAPEVANKNGYEFEGWFLDLSSSEIYIFGNMPAANLTIYAKWSIINYTIEYAPDGGSMPATYPTTYTVESNITLPAPQKTGYNFCGWYENENLTGEAIFEIALGTTGNKEYYAKYELGLYTITFDSNGGSKIENITQYYNVLITEPAAPTRYGYNFVGWFVDKNYSSEYEFDKMPAENITVYAKWSAIIYSITYHNVDDAENINPTSYTVEDVIQLATPVKNGYTFSFWYLDGNTNNIIVGISAGTTGNLNIYASWIKADNGYSIVSAPNYAFISDSELKTVVEYETTEFDFRGTFTVSANASWRAFTQADCSPAGELTLRTATDLEEGDNYYYILVENNSTYLSQVYTINVYRGHLYNVSLYNKSGSVGQSFELYEGSAITEDTIDANFDLTSVGYRLLGWYFDSDYAEAYIVGNAINKNQKNINLYSKYEAITYQIKYELNGGINSDVNPSSYTVEDANITLSDPTREGWTFDGWWLDTQFVTPITEIITSSLTDYAIYAKWVPFEFEEDADGNLTVVSYNQAFEEIVIPSTVRDKNVVGIADTAFANSTSLKSIIIPDSIVKIASGAFVGCSALEKITIPFVGTEAGKTSKDTYQYPFGYIFGTGSYIGGTEVTQYYYGSSTSSTTSSTYYIPLSLCEVTVTGGNVLYGAFYGCSMLTSVTIPDSATSIGSYAFYGCSGLASITIPDGVTSIGYEAFYGCTGLTSVTIGASVESIGSSAFRDCYKLVEVYSKSSLDITAGSTSNGYVGYYAKNVYTEEGGSWLTDTSDGYRFLYDGTNGYLMGYYGNQTELTLPASFTAYDGTKITEYGLYDYAFYNCSGLTSITIPDSVTSIGSYAFYNCSGLMSITIPAGVTSIGYEAFYGCTGLTEINWNAVSVADFASDSNVFYNAGTAGAGIAVTFGESVEKIPAYLFYISDLSYRPNIKSVITGSGVTSIGYEAFYGCTGLTSVTIGASVESIGSYAFSYCTGLTEINWNAVSAADFDYNSNVFHNAGTAGAGIAVTFGNSVEKIPAYLFYSSYSPNIKSVIIGSGVTSIGSSAFEDCTGLTEINWNAVSVADFGYYSDVFRNAGTAGAGIAVTFGESVEKIPAYVFAYCTGLTSVTIGAGVTSIGSYAFRGCDGLTSITIPDGVTSIGNYAFRECTGLTEINWNAVSVADFDYNSNVFRNAGTVGAGITVTFGDSVEEIPARLFYISDSSYRSNIKSVIIGSNVTSIGYSAFEGCTGLTSVTIPDSVTSIGDFAFYGCTGLTSVTIGASVESIGSYAFRDCYKLVEVYSKSSLDITAGSTSNGYVGYYAKNVYTEEGGSWLTDTSDGYRFLYDGTNGYLIGYRGNQTELALPASFTAYDGTEITEYGLYDYAFYKCSGLTSITIPAGVTGIGEYAFSSCTGLTSVYYAGDIAGWCGIIGLGNIMSSERTLYINGSKVEGAVTVPDGVTSIPSYAFAYQTGITSVTIPDSMTSIGSYAFYGCAGLTSVYYTGDVAGWCGISGLDEVMSSGRTLYIDGSKVEGAVTVPDGVTSIPSYAFAYQTGITSVTIPDSVTSIGSYAFRGCTAEIVWGNDPVITEIGDYAFAGYKGTSIVIPAGVTSIGDRAFYNCTGLTEINWNAVSVADFNSSSNVFYNAGTTGDGITVTFGESVEKIPARLFYVNNSSYSPNIKSVIIGSGVTSIGDYAFSGCTAEIVWGDDPVIAEIGEYAFAGYTGTSIVIPAGVTSIGEDAFYGCTAEIVWGDDPVITEIGDYAFAGYKGTSIVIPAGVTSIGSYAFSGCTGLTEINWNAVSVADFNPNSNVFYNAGTTGDGITVTFGESVEKIPARLFYVNNSSYSPYIKSVIIGSDVTSIGSYAFYNCTGLTEINWNAVSVADFNSNSNVFYNAGTAGAGITVTFGDSVEKIPAYLFYVNNSSYSPNIRSVIIGSGVTSIGDRAFYNCTGLTEINWNAVSVADFDYYSDVFYNAGTVGAGITVTFGENVQKIPAYLFYASSLSYSPNIKSVIIGSDVTSIGSYAFRGCDGLTSITIPDGVTSIEDYAFDGCTAEIVWGDDPVITEIGEYAFAGYKGTSITIPDSVTSIGYVAFGWCTGLTSITIPDSVTRIEDGAFGWCTSLTSITIPDSVTSIGMSAFGLCTGLTSVTIGAGVTSIGVSAFLGCYKLVEVYNKSTLNITVGSEEHGYVGYYAKNVYTEENGSRLTHTDDGYTFIYDGENGYLVNYAGNEADITLPESFIAYDGTAVNSYEINERAFYVMDNTLVPVEIPDSVLTSVIIPDSVTSIGNYAFSGCTGLTSVTIGDSVTSIGGSAFYGCTGLTSVTIPDSVTSIGDRAFYNCTGLTYITVNENSSYYKSIDGNLYSKDGTVLVQYAIGKTANTFEIPAGVKTIGDYAFYNCTSLTSITIPDGVTSIGDYAFSGCDGLTSITIPDGVTSIGSYAFEDCTGLTSVTIPDSVTSIGDRAFYNCSGLTSVAIGAGVKSIGDWAFSGCSGLTSITIPAGVKSIGDYAFYNCSGLTSVTIGAGVTSIGSYAFYNCTGLTSVTFEETSGWFVSRDSSATSGTDISANLSDKSTAAEYLTDTYYDYYWKRKA